MRSRLAYTLSFWLLGAVALSVLAMGGLTAWNLRQGFSAYLQARDLERFETFAGLVSTDFQQQLKDTPGLTHEQLRAPLMQSMLRQLDGLEGTSLPARERRGAPGDGGDGLAPPRGERFGAGPGPRPGRLEGPGGPPPRDRPPRRGGDGPSADGEGFGSRVALARSDGRPWIGPPIQLDDPDVIERPILLAGTPVALLRLRPRQRAPEAHESQFLRSQYIGIAALAAALLLLALGVALWLARQWVRPLQAVQAATARIAQGELDVRLSIQRSDEIGDVVRNVNSMAQSLQRIEGARRRWLADLSHELRTPLTALRGDIEALVDGVRPLNAAAVALLREDVLGLGRVVDDLHLLAMADLKALPCHFADDDAEQTLQRVLRRQSAQATMAGLTLTAAAGRQPLPVHWDSSRIEQLLANLLQNSLRYTDAPGRIEVAWRVNGGQLHLTVDDSAPGVAAADRARLFEPLFRTDEARSRERGGSGLGLAICEAIVHAHRGRISASASALGGLRVEIVLPCNAPSSLT